MASRQAIGRCFDVLESAGFVTPDAWRPVKDREGLWVAKRQAARNATGDAWELALNAAGIDDATLMTAVGVLMAHTTERFWPTPGVLIGCIKPSSGKADQEGAADAALAELRIRAGRWRSAPVSPVEPDCEVLPAGPVLIADRFNAGRKVQPRDADGNPLVRPARRVDGRWRVSGDELRQTDREAEAVVWRVLSSLGGIDALRLAAGDENTAAWGGYAAAWRRQWVALANGDAYAARLFGPESGLARLTDRGGRPLEDLARPMGGD